MMTVAQLRFLLAQYNDADAVILSSDSGGDSYSPLLTVQGNQVYVRDNIYTGEVYYIELTDQLKAAGFSEAHLTPKNVQGVKCVVLTPIN